MSTRVVVPSTATNRISTSVASSRFPHGDLAPLVLETGRGTFVDRAADPRFEDDGRGEGVRHRGGVFSVSNVKRAAARPQNCSR